MTIRNRPLALISRSDETQLLTPNGYSNSRTQVTNSVYTDTRDGVSQPKWRSIIKSGGNATTNMTGTKFRRLAYVPFYFGCGYKPVVGDPAYYLETFRGLPGFASSVPGHVNGSTIQEADNLALKMAYGRLQQMRNQFQGLTFLGELSEALKFIRHPFQAMQDLLKVHFRSLSYKVGKTGNSAARYLHSPARQRKLREIAAETWLETAFGLIPLKSDIKSAAEAIARFQNDSRREVIVGYGSSESASQPEPSTSPLSYGNAMKCKTTFRDYTQRTVRYKVFVDHSRSANFGSAERLIELSGFHPNQFVPQLYELIPWSFFVDYFSNLGDLIQAGCASQQGVKIVIKTTRVTTTRSMQFVPFNGLDSIIGHRTHSTTPVVGEAITERSDVTREGSSALGLPTLEISLPGKPLQWANTVALLASDAFKLSGSRQNGIRF